MCVRVLAKSPISRPHVWEGEAQTPQRLTEVLISGCTLGLLTARSVVMVRVMVVMVEMVEGCVVAALVVLVYPPVGVV